ncbi:MAG: HEAT repeat domain-containing protein [Planctomycetes bacterium]|nr:HEAT repeat domain-containing protein [Planctomycetota bacterium]
MDLYFCDLCQEAVPQRDVRAGRAWLSGERVVCAACNSAMGGGAAAAPPAADAPAESGAPASAPALRATRRGSGVTPGVAAALSSASVLLVLAISVLLLWRVEHATRTWDADFAQTRASLDELERLRRGTRERMAAEAGAVAEDVLRGELGRVETLERQVADLRGLLASGEPRSGAENDESRAELREALLTAGDGLARVQELEQQVLFLQARVYELAEAPRLAAAAPAVDAPRPLPLPKTLEELVGRLADRDPVERVGALYALHKVSDPGVAAHVVPLLEDDDAYVRALAARTLERLDARSAAAALIDHLDDVDAEVREACASALRAVTGEQLAYDPRASQPERRAGQARWRTWWGDHGRALLYGEE